MKSPKIPEILKSIRKTDRFFGTSYFYNLDNNRDNGQVSLELKAMAQEKPHTIELVEAIGNKLPDLKGYTLLHDKSSKSRENVAAYVRDDMDVYGPWYDDHKETWGRTQTSGTHEPRSTMYYRIGWMQRVVGHQGPNRTDNTQAVQKEGIERIAAKMAPWKKKKAWSKATAKKKAIQWLRPRMLFWDANARQGENGPGPDMLAKKIKGKVHGRWIDNLVTRRVKVHSLIAVTSVRRVRLRSDHKHALVAKWSVRSAWIKKGGKI